MKDPRTQCPALRHSYAGMLAMVAVAMMFAANGPTAVVRFWNDIAGHRPRRRQGLLRALGLEKLPSHDALEPISIGFERKRGCGVVAIFPGMEAIDGWALFGRSARAGAA